MWNVLTFTLPEMALLTCEDCGKQVSDLAAACPHCGRPVPSAAERDVAAEHRRAAERAELAAARRVIPESVTRADPERFPRPREKGLTKAQYAAVSVGALILLAAGLVAANSPGEMQSAAFSSGLGSQALPPAEAPSSSLLNYPAPASTNSLSARSFPKPAQEMPKYVAPTAWDYYQTTDGIGNGVTAWAKVQSTNTVDFSFPYAGPQHASLLIYRGTRRAGHVMFTIERGQLLCRSYDGCTVEVQFDDKEPVSFSASGASDNSTEVLFINNYTRFVSGVKKASRVRIQASIYQQGAPVFSFDTHGFDAGRYSAPLGGKAR